MASSSSSSIFANATLGSNVTITQDEFNSFHNIDRKLFLSLVVHIGCEPTRAMQVMALFMWFEKICKNFKLISQILEWPHTLLGDLVNEAMLVLTCIQSDCYPFVITKKYDLPLIQKITRRVVTLHFFHDNRLDINREITHFMNNICVKAFADIMQRFQPKKDTEEKVFHCGNPRSGVVDVNNGVFHNNVAYSNEMVNNEVSEMLRSLNLSGGVNNNGETSMDVPIDDRTIFLTFSKGYPIVEAEIRDFFTRNYGDIVEAIYMQEVHGVIPHPLYARLVLRGGATNMMGVILAGSCKVKFSINGKHVWARKYVPKTAARTQD